MTLSIYLLTQSDFSVYDSFLAQYADTSMFLRSNARRGGLDARPLTEYGAWYFGALEGNSLVGVLALDWKGGILAQCPDLTVLKQLVIHAFTEQPNFSAVRLLAPGSQSCLISDMLRITPEAIQIFNRETVFTLNHANIIVPENLRTGIWTCRFPRPAEMPALARQGAAYRREVGIFTEKETPDHLEKATRSLQRDTEQGLFFVLEVDNTLVAQCRFNATLPDIYQIGGVYTPPDHRGKGYARAVVAGALLEAKKQGIPRSVLFTDNPAAIHAYEAVGYKRIKEDYHATVFREPVRVGSVVSSGIESRPS